MHGFSFSVIPDSVDVHFGGGHFPGDPWHGLLLRLLCSRLALNMDDLGLDLWDIQAADYHVMSLGKAVRTI